MRACTAQYHPKGASRLGRHPLPFEQWTKSTVMLIAHFLFDGRITHSACKYYNRSPALISSVHEAMRSVYEYEPRVSIDKNDVMAIEYCNVELAAYIRTKADELLSCVATMDKELRRSFLQAFFDDEGCISHERSKRHIRGYQHDRATLELVQHLLANFGIESKIDRQGVELTISRKANIIRFRDEIGFSPGVHVNGARKNSIWREFLEKRVILDRAIASYLPPGTPGVSRSR